MCSDVEIKCTCVEVLIQVYRNELSVFSWLYRMLTRGGSRNIAITARYLRVVRSLSARFCSHGNSDATHEAECLC